MPPFVFPPQTNFHTVPAKIVRDSETALELLIAAFRGGVNFFDTAEGNVSNYHW